MPKSNVCRSASRWRLKARISKKPCWRFLSQRKQMKWLSKSSWRTQMSLRCHSRQLSAHLKRGKARIGSWKSKDNDSRCSRIIRHQRRLCTVKANKSAPMYMRPKPRWWPSCDLIPSTKAKTSRKLLKSSNALQAALKWRVLLLRRKHSLHPSWSKRVRTKTIWWSLKSFIRKSRIWEVSYPLTNKLSRSPTQIWID